MFNLKLKISCKVILIVYNGGQLIKQRSYEKMKIVLNDVVDFAEIEMDCIPRSGESIFYEDRCYLVYEVEWSIGESIHVNLMLQKV